MYLLLPKDLLPLGLTVSQHFRRRGIRSRQGLLSRCQRPLGWKTTTREELPHLLIVRVTLVGRYPTATRYTITGLLVALSL